MTFLASAREISRTLAFLKSLASAFFSLSSGSSCSAIRSRITRWNALPLVGKSLKSFESCASQSAASVTEFFNAKMSFFPIVGFNRFRSRITVFSFSFLLADSTSRINSDAITLMSGSVSTSAGVTISLISRRRAAVVSSPSFSRA